MLSGGGGGFGNPLNLDEQKVEPRQMLIQCQ
jgi:hypothetical protein